MKEKLPGTILPSPWIEFGDDAGSRVCQPDAIWQPPDGRILVLEMKLRRTQGGEEELRQLYLPVVGKLLGCRPSGLQVCWSIKGLQSRKKLFVGLDAEIDLPPEDVGTWFIRV